MGCIKSTKRRGPCKDHGVIAYSQRYDAYFCPVSKEWLEPECKCGPGDECPVAKPRPATAEGLSDDMRAGGFANECDERGIEWIR